MGNLQKVKVVNCLHHLQEDYSCVFLAKTTMLIEPIKQLTARAQAE
jgi:hypothetical protein